MATKLDAAMDNVTASRLGQIALDAGDAGHPGIGDLIDRGLILVRYLRERGFEVSPVPAPPTRTEEPEPFSGAELNAVVRAIKGEDVAPPCAKCGGVYQYDTVIPSELWNKVIRDGGHKDYLCLNCIMPIFIKARVSFTAELWGEGLHGSEHHFRVRVAADPEMHSATEMMAAYNEESRRTISRLREQIETMRTDAKALADRHQRIIAVTNRIWKTDKSREDFKELWSLVVIDPTKPSEKDVQRLRELHPELFPPERP